ncbi:MAG: cell division protein SepF [Thermosynechococcaceae cyanobacterium]
MSSSLLGRLKEFVGMPDAEGYEEYVDFEDIQGEDFADLYATEEFQDQPEQPMTQPDITRGTQMNTVSTNNVVGMPGTNRFWGSATEVLVMEPNAFEEMPQVIQALREQKSVVLNLTMMDPAQAQRAVDFVAGATYTIDGHQERVGDSIFLFTPNCVQVSTQFGEVHEAPQPATASRSTAAAFQPQGQTILNQIAQ